MVHLLPEQIADTADMPGLIDVGAHLSRPVDPDARQIDVIGLVAGEFIRPPRCAEVRATEIIEQVPRRIDAVEPDLTAVDNKVIPADAHLLRRSIGQHPARRKQNHSGQK